MSLATIAALIQAGTSLVLVEEASDTPPYVSLEDDMKALLTPVFGEAVYPATQYKLQPPDGQSATYELARSTPDYIEGVPVMQTDIYVVRIRSTHHLGFGALSTQVAAVLAAIGASTLPVTVTDRSFDFDEKNENYVYSLEVTFLTPATSAGAGSLPSALLYPIFDAGDESITDNKVQQVVDRHTGLVIFDAAGNIETIRAEVRAVLLGYTLTPEAEHWAHQFNRGDKVESRGVLSVWREIYRDRYYIGQT